MLETIPVIDVADFLAGQSGALEATAFRLREALTEVGFFVLTGHDVPLALIDRTFAEARRFHNLPMTTKIALKLNEHVNGYMAMSRYAVWTSDDNKNDKPDLNEAFFVKRERAPDDPLRLSGRRFVGPNLWPEDGQSARISRSRARICRQDERYCTPVPAGGRCGARPRTVLVRCGVRGQPVHVPAVALPAGRGRRRPVRHCAAHRQ